MKIAEAFADALYDYFFLLRRGYPWRSARELVAARYGLSRRTQVLLHRCVAPMPVELLSPRDMSGRCVAVDAYNQLASIYAALAGEPVYLCLDGLVRDALAAGPAHVTRAAAVLASFVAAALEMVKPSRLILVFDSQPSRSGETASTVKKVLADSTGVSVEARLTPRADKTLINLSRACIVASSDTVVVNRAGRVLDLARHVIEVLGLERAITHIRPALETRHNGWCGGGPVA